MMSILAVVPLLTFATHRDVPYYPAEAYTGDYMRAFCKLDLRVPKGTNGFATVVWFHGGGLVGGWRDEFYSTPQDDVASVSVDYRLLTNATPAECLSDAGAAVAWTLKHIGEYGGDPRKVFVSGSSGGGYLTLMVGMDPRWLAPHGFRPTDLAGLLPETGQVSTHFNIRKATGDSTSRYVTKVDEWAPLAYAARDLPPMLIQTGEPEVDIPCRAEENRLLYAALRALGHGDIEFRAYAGRRHGTMRQDVRPFESDFIGRRIRQIDGVDFSAGGNPVRRCLEEGVACGLKADFVSIASDVDYRHSAVCVQKTGNRTDLSGDGTWLAPLLARLAELVPGMGAAALADELGLRGTRRRKDGSWVTTAEDAIRLAELIAHRGTWHGRRIVPSARFAAAFPLPFAFAGRVFADADGRAFILFSTMDVSAHSAFAACAEKWRRAAVRRLEDELNGPSPRCLWIDR